MRNNIEVLIFFHHHHHHHHHTIGLTQSSASGQRYKVSVTDVFSVRKSWKTDTSSTISGMMRTLYMQYTRTSNCNNYRNSCTTDSVIE